MNRLPNGDGLTPDICGVPPNEGPEIFILRLKANMLYTFSIYSKAMWGIWVHWNGKKSEPHYKEEHRCPGCLAKRPKRWKGFIHCFCYELGQEVFLELTPHSAKSLLAQIGPGMNLRGNRVQVKRGKGDNGRLSISLLSAITTTDAIPPEKDPHQSIMALWGFGPGSPIAGRELPATPSKNGAFH